MMPRILVLEGDHAAGTSTHADLLTAALQRDGVRAVAFHHTRPAHADPMSAALGYAIQRREFLLACKAEVVVADRWRSSTWAKAYQYMFLGDGYRDQMVGYAMRGLFQAEAEYARESALVLLTAEDDVLSARLAERGITPITREVLAERRAFAESMKAAGWPSVNTGRSVDVVAADLYAWAKERLG